MKSIRLNHQSVEKSINSCYVTAILGPRRTGKTYFLENYAKEHPENRWVFFNMDILEQRIRASTSQLSIMIAEQAKQHLGEGEKIWVVIDEAQKCPEIFDQIKVLYDRYKDQNKIKFIISGSAVLSLHQLSAESLAGRIELHHFYEFNLREAALLHEPSIPTISILDNLTQIEAVENAIHQLIIHRPLLEKELGGQLVWGAFPETLSMQTDEQKLIYLNNYLQTYLEKDVRAIETITDIHLYKNLLDILAEQTGSLHDDQRMVHALGCTRDTLKKYRGYVEATLLYTDVYPYIGSTLKRLVKSPKSYLLSNGLVSILTGILDIQILQKTGLVGHRLENWFLKELNVWIARSPVRHQINFWRTSSGAEVDFVVVKKPFIFPFEVTYSTDIDRKKMANLETFLREEPKAQWGYYIYRGDFRIDHEKRIIFIPCWAVG